MKNLDWVDILLHVVIGTAFVAAFIPINAAAPILTAAWFNMCFWFLREMYQQYKKGKPLSATEWSAQKHWEWMAPTVCGTVVAVVKVFTL